jgi:hypothetical protein
MGVILWHYTVLENMAVPTNDGGDLQAFARYTNRLCDSNTVLRFALTFPGFILETSRCVPFPDHISD